MATPDQFSAILGDWSGLSRLWLDPSKDPFECTKSTTARKIINDQSLELNYLWSLEGENQSGKLIITFSDDGKANASWLDSWHMAHQMMHLEGSFTESDVTLLGGYAAPPGPDWGWSIKIELNDSSQWTFKMFNITPDGESSLAVQADFKQG